MNSSPPSRSNASTLSPSLERLARKRVGMRLGFLAHATAYVVVISGLSLLAFNQGKFWAIWPALGWGVGLLMHGLATLQVLGYQPSSGLYKHWLNKERAKLRQQDQARL